MVIAELRNQRLVSGKFKGLTYGQAVVRRDVREYVESVRPLLAFQKKFPDIKKLVQFYDYAKKFFTFQLDLYEQETAVKELTKRFSVPMDGEPVEFRWRVSMTINLPKYVVHHLVKHMRFIREVYPGEQGYFHHMGVREPFKTKELYKRLYEEIGRFMPNFGKQIMESLMTVWKSSAGLFTITQIRDAPNMKSIPVINPIHQTLKRDSTVEGRQMISDFIGYEIGDMVYKNVGKSYMKNLCVFTNIINVFNTDHNRRKYPDFCNMLTYENLRAMCFGDQYTLEELQKRGIKISDVFVFFERYGLSLSIVDINYQKLHEIRSDRDSGIRPQTAYFMIHNDHLYELNEHLQKISRREVNFKASERSIYMRLPKKVEREHEVKTIVLNSVDTKDENFQKSLTIIENEIRNASETPTEFIVNSNLMLPITLWSYKTLGIEPQIVCMQGSKLVVVRLSKHVSLKTHESNNGPFNFASQSPDYVQKIMDQDFALRERIMKDEHLSEYSPKTYAVLSMYKPTPIYGQFQVPDKSIKSFREWDFKKYYASILAYHIKNIPKLNQFDDPVVYNGEEIEDYNLYVCEKIDDDLCFPLMKRFGAYYGFNIRDSLNNLKIHYVIPVSQVVSAHGLNEAVKDLYTSDDIEEEHQKLIGNKNIGLLSQSMKRKNKGFLTTSLHEAKVHTENKKTMVHEIAKDIILEGEDSETLYLCMEQKELAYKSGFMPIGHMIVETASRVLWDLKQDLQNIGFTVYSAQTDCLRQTTMKNW
jgi:hypothetical protein